LFIGNTFGLKYYLKYTTRVTEMLKNYTDGRQATPCRTMFKVHLRDGPYLRNLACTHIFG
jgi:hypothetical protein